LPPFISTSAGTYFLHNVIYADLHYIADKKLYSAAEENGTTHLIRRECRARMLINANLELLNSIGNAPPAELALAT